MPKRLTDTEKWKKRWIRNLPSECKLFWVYILDDCNHAGIWDVDMEIANIKLKTSLTEDGILKTFDGKIQSIDNGKKWFITGFTDYQYGILNPNNRVHNSVISMLEKEGVLKGLTRPLIGCKDKAKAKDKDKAKDKAKAKKYDFESVWQKYPAGKKQGKEEARGYFNMTVKTDEDMEKIQKAVANYNIHIEAEAVEDKYIQKGGNWFSEWRDWVDYEPKSVRGRPPGIFRD